jgi:MFS transporter, DHA1 family, multidrug resistance protein
VLFRLSLGAAFAYCAYAMCRAPVLPLYAQSLGAGPQLIGVVAAASTVTGILLKLPAGALSDAVGRRVVLLSATSVFALLPFAYPWIAGVTSLVLLRAVHGTATALFGPTASAALSDVAPATARGRWLGTYSAVQGFGQALGPLIGGVLLQRAGYSAVFVTAGVIGCAAWPLVAGWPPGQRARRRQTWSDLAAGVRQVSGDARLIATGLAQGSQFMLHGLLQAFLPVYAVDTLRLSAAQAGGIFASQMLTTILARPLVGTLSDRLGRRRLIVLGLVICGLAIVGVSRAGGVAGLLAAMLAYGLGLAVTTASTSALVTDLADRARYGAAHGLFGTLYDVGDAVGPIAGGLVAAAVGYRWMFTGSAALAILAAAAFAAAARRWRFT